MVGFTGRYIGKKQDVAKYLNTSETELYSKKNTLFGLHLALREIKVNSTVVLVEGNPDVVRLHEIGVGNAVAPMGTALTKEQIDILRQYAKSIIIIGDTDNAGVEAVVKNGRTLLEAGFNVRLMVLPDGKDPDEFLKKNGEDGLQKCLLNNQTSAMGFIYNLYSKTTLFDDVNSKESFKNTIFKNLCKFKSNALIETFLNKLANDLSVSFESVKNDYLLFSKNVDNFKKNDVKYEVVDEETITSEVKIINKFEFNKYLLAEKRLIRAAFENKNDCFYIESALGYSFVEKNNRNLLFKLRVYYQKHELMNYDDFKSLLDDEELINIMDEIINNEEVPEKKIIDEYIDLLGEYLSAKIVRDIIEDEDRNIENLKTLAENKKRTIKLQRKGVK